MRAKINRGALTIGSEESINNMQGQKNMTGLNTQALNLHLSKQKGMDIRPACTFCKIRRYYPLSQKLQLHFYSECLYTQRFWTEIKDWAQPPLKGNYSIRDRIL